MFSELMPPQELIHSQVSEDLVAYIAIGDNADEVASNINMFVCSIATWKDLSCFLWIEAYRNVISM